MLRDFLTGYVPILVAVIVVFEIRLQREKAAHGEYGFVLWWRTLRKKGAKKAFRRTVALFSGPSAFSALKISGGSDGSDGSDSRQDRALRRATMLKGAKFGVMGKVILTTGDDHEDNEQLVARFTRILRDHGSAVDFDFVEAEVMLHKKETSRLGELRRRKPLDTVASPAALALKLRDALQKEGMLGTHSYHLRHYKMSFTGADAVQVLISHRLATDPADAHAKAQQLLDSGLFTNLKKDTEFENEHVFYRFKQDEEQGGKKKKRKKRRPTVDQHDENDEEVVNAEIENIEKMASRAEGGGAASDGKEAAEDHSSPTAHGPRSETFVKILSRPEGLSVEVEAAAAAAAEVQARIKAEQAAEEAAPEAEVREGAEAEGLAAGAEAEAEAEVEAEAEASPAAEEAKAATNDGE